MEKLMNKQECMEYLNVKTDATFYKLINVHKMPFLSLPGQKRFAKKDLDEWMKSKKNVEIIEK